jgi:chitinase
MFSTRVARALGIFLSLLAIDQLRSWGYPRGSQFFAVAYSLNGGNRPFSNKVFPFYNRAYRIKYSPTYNPPYSSNSSNSSSQTQAPGRYPRPLPKSSWPNHTVAGYYYSGDADSMAPAAVPYHLLTHILFAFGEIGSDYTVNLTGSEDLLTAIASNASSHGVKPVLSVGGWGASQMFSSMVASNATRSTFIQSLKAVVDKYTLTGVDIDWEYPGRFSLPGTPFNNVTDFPNLLLLFTELRQEFGNEFSISAAVGMITPFAELVQEMAEVVDWFGFMVYDYAQAVGYETSSNAPLGGPAGGTVDISNWFAAGLPANKSLFGVPSYGQNFTLLDVSHLLDPR